MLLSLHAYRAVVCHLAAITSVAATACAASSHSSYSSDRPRLIVNFATAYALETITRVSPHDSVRRVFQNVLEVGGALHEYRGDTLVLEPDYLTTYDTITSNGSRIHRVPNKEAHVILAFIPRDAASSVRQVAQSSRTRPKVLAGLMLLGIVVYTVCCSPPAQP